MDIHHLLAPTDFSAHVHQAVTAAFALAQTFGAKLSRLHVIEAPAYAGEVALPLENLERDARRELARLLPVADTAHVEVTRLVDVGVPHMATTDSVGEAVRYRHASVSSEVLQA